MSIEAMLSLLAFFSVLGFFLQAAVQQLETTEKISEKITAISQAQKCAIAIDSVNASPDSTPKIKTTDCFQEKNGSVSSKKNNSTTSSAILAETISINQKNNSQSLEVKTNAHYR